MQPLLRFGLLTDIQYADIDDRMQVYSKRWRYYRNSLRILNNAVEDYNKMDDLKMVLHLGDIIDGFASNDSDACLDKVLACFDRLKTAHHHIVGNHCLYNFDKDTATRRLGISRLSGQDSHAYYTLLLSPTTKTTSGIRLVVLDTFDISTIAYPDPSHPKHIRALQLVTSHNTNNDLLDPSGLVGAEKRFVLFNGGVDTDQLTWLDETLAQAAAAKEKVIIASHVPFCDGISRIGLCWNYEEVLSIIHRYGKDVVPLCLSGHNHARLEATDSAGIHHTSLEAVLEAGPMDVPCYGTVSVFADKILITGCGDDTVFATTEIPIVTTLTQ